MKMKMMKIRKKSRILILILILILIPPKLSGNRPAHKPMVRYLWRAFAPPDTYRA